MTKSKDKVGLWKKIEPGIRVRVHPTRKHGPRPDMYFVLRYSVRGEEIQEALGWSSEGWTLAKARLELVKLKEAIRIGEGPVTLREKRKIAQQEREKEKLKMTIQQLWEYYDSEKPERSIRNADKTNFKHFKNEIGNKEVEELYTKDIDAIKKNMLHSGYSLQTIKHVLGLIRRVLLFCQRKGKCVLPSPFQLTFEMPKFDNTVTEYLTTEEIERLLKALAEEKDQVQASVMRLALATGMRKGALLGLKWKHLDFERKVITLAGETAKNGKMAYIPMNEAARKILDALPRTSVYVFPGKGGGKRGDIRRMAARIREKAKLPGSFRPLHGLRHTFACNLANSGKVKLYTIQHLLTHSSPVVTQRYAHLADDILREGSEVASSSILECGLTKNCSSDEP